MINELFLNLWTEVITNLQNLKIRIKILSSEVVGSLAGCRSYLVKLRGSLQPLSLDPRYRWATATLTETEEASSPSSCRDSHQCTVCTSHHYHDSPAWLRVRYDLFLDSFRFRTLTLWLSVCCWCNFSNRDPVQDFHRSQFQSSDWEVAFSIIKRFGGNNSDCTESTATD